MIVYNVGRRFFAMKNDADAYRRANGWKPSTLNKITIANRDQLAAFLDGLCEPAPTAQSPLPDVRIEVEVPDFIPAFLLKDWGIKR